MRILIGCPTYVGKRYSLARYLDSLRNISHPGTEILLVDTSPDTKYFEELQPQVPCVHIQVNEPPNRKIALGMQVLRDYALEKGFDWWWSVESDIIVPSCALDFMLSRSKGFDFVTLPYESRTQPGVILERSFGCSLFSKRLLERVDFRGAPSDTTTDGWFWGEYHPITNSIRSALKVEHLSECSNRPTILEYSVK